MLLTGYHLFSNVTIILSTGTLLHCHFKSSPRIAWSAPQHQTTARHHMEEVKQLESHCLFSCSTDLRSSSSLALTDFTIVAWKSSAPLEHNRKQSESQCEGLILLHYDQKNIPSLWELKQCHTTLYSFHDYLIMTSLFWASRSQKEPSWMSLKYHRNGLHMYSQAFL